MMTDILIAVIRVLIVFGIINLMAGLLLWSERRISGLMQDRWGPNRVGPMGLMQPLADTIKLIFKEDITPRNVDKLLYYIAPAMTLVPAILAFSIVPFGDPIEIDGRRVLMQVAGLGDSNLELGILFFIAVASLEIYGIIFGAWASNNKYSLLGGIRSAAQMLSYELFLGASIIGVIMLTGSLRLVDIVQQQNDHLLFGFLPAWNIFRQPLGFLVFCVAAFAETNRMPFDLPESEQELVGGYHTEYSSMKFVMFFIAEYAAVFTLSALIATIFLGGYGWPGLTSDLVGPTWLPIIQALTFMFKTLLVCFVFIAVRWTVSRFRYDQVMRLGWKVMLPIAFLNILLTGALMPLFR